ncbi:hypothetical protein 1 [Changjiang tombus-like virus 17]|uniref:hypothetical protein 1 n=1 Tax=Changjiang tombus-like virus 17 TaxID=1922810 RepID=UPI00090AB5FC|nr:hypothetical protein 1 [Changjiang tombus-like virus 17]APG76256.1 hypothetical protein 1 [Changjiang tombus-like virus 17]
MRFLTNVPSVYEGFSGRLRSWITENRRNIILGSFCLIASGLTFRKTSQLTLLFRSLLGLLGAGLSFTLGNNLTNLVSLQLENKAKIARRGTRGKMRAIRHRRVPLTNLHFEVESLCFDGLRNSSDVTDIARRLKQIAMSSGLEVYSDDGTVNKVPVKDLNMALVDSVVRDCVLHISDPDVLRDIEVDAENRDMAMRRLLSLGNAGQILSGWEHLKISALKCGAAILGRSYLVGRN